MSPHFSLDEIRKITIKLDSNKAHGHCIASICMLEIFGESVSKPLKLILKSHLIQKIFFIRKIKEKHLTDKKKTNYHKLLGCLASHDM